MGQKIGQFLIKLDLFHLTKELRKAGPRQREGGKKERNVGIHPKCDEQELRSHVQVVEPRCTNNNTASKKEHANFTRTATRRHDKQARTEVPPFSLLLHAFSC